jgi:hypothetical protein
MPTPDPSLALTANVADSMQLNYMELRTLESSTEEHCFKITNSLSVGVLIDILSTESYSITAPGYAPCPAETEFVYITEAKVGKQVSLPAGHFWHCGTPAVVTDPTTKISTKRSENVVITTDVRRGPAAEASARFHALESATSK